MKRMFHSHHVIVGVAIAALAGCGGAQSPISAPGAIPQAVQIAGSRAIPRRGAAKTTLIITEQGPSHFSGTVEIYTAPFTGHPQILHKYSPKGAAIAPDGALIIATESDGTWVYDPPWTGKPRQLGSTFTPTGQLLFDSKGRLFVPFTNGGVVVFDPPYKGAPAFGFPVASGVDEVAFDSYDNLFVGPTLVSSPIEECRAPLYTKCKGLTIGIGALAVDSADNLFANRGYGKLVEFPPPYRRPSARTKPGFNLDEIATAAGAVFVAGLDDQNSPHLGIFISPIKTQMLQIPVGSDFNPWLQFWVAKNRDLFVSAGSYQKPCVVVYPYPYQKPKIRCIPAQHQITAVFAQ